VPHDLVAFNLAVPQVDNPVGVFRDFALVRYQDYGVFLPMQAFKQGHDLFAGATIKIAGGLVGQQD
jgi:hypothetical protein